MTEERAREVLRAEGRRGRVIVLIMLVVIYLGYLAVQVWILDRSVPVALGVGAVLVVGIGAMQYFFFAAPWVRRPDASVERVEVLQSTTTGHGAQAVTLGNGRARVRVGLSRTTPIFGVGDTVFVSPCLRPHGSMGLVMPENVSRLPRVLAVNGDPA
ncbi:hypothetical protein [uncultured Serinicoccus sp.]|uniref:hypothetical protein n=1 Tax=uncultured Serinicoccus sp. TaxID=735514 RepID=UPI0026193BD4|nr:hypothetical protein [uncultured Serinicoccus sp.]